MRLCLASWLALVVLEFAGSKNFSSGQVHAVAIPSDGRSSVYAGQGYPVQETLRTAERSLHKSKSPWLAVGLSATLPGLGQIYNENYWKVPVIWGLGAYWVYEWIQQNKRYKDFRDKYTESILENPPYGNEQFLRSRNFYRDDRDKFAWFLGALYLFNLVDAYVGANLYSFDVTPDLTLDGRVVVRLNASLRLGF